LIKAVGEIFKVKEKEIKMSGIRGNMTRNVAIYMSKRYCGLTNQEIGNIFGEIHHSPVSKASGRLEERIKKDKKSNIFIEEIKSHVKA